jgi:hypothetical protein
MPQTIGQGDTQSQDEPEGFNSTSREALQTWIKEQTGIWEPNERPERNTVQKLIDRLQRSED